MTDAEFKKEIGNFYRKNRRDLPWRNTRIPYRIFVSEIMLQQTQVSRVIPKYHSFIKKFPTFKALASARLRDILTEWKGLGYNRRALNLKRATEIIVKDYKGKLPAIHSELVELPGIGPNTAGSLLAFAYNIPHPFIETNIRSVYIHFFFQDKAGIHDKELLPLISNTLPKEKVREWYYALMDYGVFLKHEHPNPSRRSRHHVRQTPFKGSRRELRSKILRAILAKPSNFLTIHKETSIPLLETQQITEELQREGLIQKKGGKYFVD